MANENDQIQDSEVTQDTEVAQEESTGFTPEQQAAIDAIISARVNEVKEQSAAELRAVRENAEAQIAGYQRATEQIRAVPVQQGADDPEPPGMDQNQRLMWHANKPMRDYMKQEAARQRAEMARTVNPLLHDSTVAGFFRDKPNVPASIKASAAALFQQAANDPRVTLDPNQIMQASYIRALAQAQEASWSAQPNTKPIAKATTPAPRVVLPNGQGSEGGGTRPLGVGRVGGGSNKTWQEIQQELIASNKFPEDPL